jgi:hypothetical protein
MNSVVVLLLPIASTAIAIAVSLRLAARQVEHPQPAILAARKVAIVFLLANTVASMLFGSYIAFQVACCSGERSMWVMPLIFAPIEYWRKFGLPIAASAAATAAVILIRNKRQ